MQANRPFANINGTVIPIFSNGNNNYNSVNFRLEKRYTNGFALVGELYDSEKPGARGRDPILTHQNGTSIAMDTYNLAREKSVAPIDVPQILSASGGYALPFGPGSAGLPVVWPGNSSADGS